MGRKTNVYKVRNNRLSICPHYTHIITQDYLFMRHCITTEMLVMHLYDQWTATEIIEKENRCLLGLFLFYLVCTICPKNYEPFFLSTLFSKSIIEYFTYFLMFIIRCTCFILSQFDSNLLRDCRHINFT